MHTISKCKQWGNHGLVRETKLLATKQQFLPPCLLLGILPSFQEQFGESYQHGTVTRMSLHVVKGSVDFCIER